MRKLFVALVAAVVFASSGATSCFAVEKIFKAEVVYTVGDVKARNDWIQGLDVVENKIYMLDGAMVKVMEQGVTKELYDLYKLKPDLEQYGLNDDTVIKSFRLATIKQYNGELYLSGLVFKNTEDEGKRYRDDPVNGYTYNLIFKIEKGRTAILHVSQAKINTGYDYGDFYETESGLPEDVYYNGGDFLYDFSKYVVFPKMTFDEEGRMVVVRESAENPAVEKGPLREVVLMEKGKERVLFKWNGTAINGSEISWHHVLPVYDYGELTIYSGGLSIHTIDPITGEIKSGQVPRDMLLQRPAYVDGKMYFLNNEMFYRLSPGHFNGKTIYGGRKYMAEDFDFSGLISAYTYDGKYLYLANYEKRTIHKMRL